MERALREVIAEYSLDVVVLARYMQVLSDTFCRDFRGKATTDTAAAAAPRIPADDLIDRLWSVMHEIEAADFPALSIVELDEPTDYSERTVLWCPRCDQHVNVEDGYLRAIDVDVRYNSVGQIDTAERTVPQYEADPGDVLVYLHQTDEHGEHGVRLPEGWEGTWKA